MFVFLKIKESTNFFFILLSIILFFFCLYLYFNEKKLKQKVFDLEMEMKEISDRKILKSVSDGIEQDTISIQNISEELESHQKSWNNQSIVGFKEGAELKKKVNINKKEKIKVEKGNEVKEGTLSNQAVLNLKIEEKNIVKNTNSIVDDVQPTSKDNGNNQYNDNNQYNGDNRYNGNNQYNDNNRYNGDNQYNGNNQYNSGNQYNSSKQPIKYVATKNNQNLSFESPNSSLNTELELTMTSKPEKYLDNNSQAINAMIKNGSQQDYVSSQNINMEIKNNLQQDHVLSQNINMATKNNLQQDYVSSQNINMMTKNNLQQDYVSSHNENNLKSPKEIPNLYSKNVNSTSPTIPLIRLDDDDEIEAKVNVEKYSFNPNEFVQKNEKIVPQIKENNNKHDYLKEVSNHMANEIKPQTIELTDYEKDQEEHAVISYQELLALKDKVEVQDDERVNFIDDLKQFQNTLHEK